MSIISVKKRAYARGRILLESELEHLDLKARRYIIGVDQLLKNPYWGGIENEPDAIRHIEISLQSQQMVGQGYVPQEYIRM